jgi:hypothetical protein
MLSHKLEKITKTHIIVELREPDEALTCDSSAHLLISLSLPELDARLLPPAAKLILTDSPEGGR